MLNATYTKVTTLTIPFFVVLVSFQPKKMTLHERYEASCIDILITLKSEILKIVIVFNSF